MKAGTGAFDLKKNARLVVLNSDPEVVRVANYLAEKVNRATGFSIPVVAEEPDYKKGDLVFRIVAESDLGQEGYDLLVDKQNIVISANGAEGLFRAIQTLRQLMPADIERTASGRTDWLVPACSIRDFPRFAYRGAMLDVSRHFFGVEAVKQFMEYLVSYKMNVLHLHLSDDQGWRIEIKSWPNLTAHGGKTQVGGGPGGFYTQEEFAELIQYARDRFITIVPEIDMPGHTNAALASYAELNESGKATELYSGTEVGFSTLATRKEITYQFVDDVVRELAALNPGPYIHIGGDESHVTKKEDYVYFMNRAQDIVATHGKTTIGWDEIATTTLKPGSIVQHWASVENAQLAVQQGAKILLSPSKRVYLDMKYDSTTVLGLNWAGYIDVDASYDWDPASLIPGIGEGDIAGIESPLWSETVETMEDIHFLVFPRLLGVAEIAWSPAGLRTMDSYKQRLAKQAESLKAMNIKYYKSPLIQWEEKN
jgi:hexosaminidase